MLPKYGFFLVTLVDKERKKYYCTVLAKDFDMAVAKIMDNPPIEFYDFLVEPFDDEHKLWREYEMDIEGKFLDFNRYVAGLAT